MKKNEEENCCGDYGGKIYEIEKSSVLSNNH